MKILDVRIKGNAIRLYLGKDSINIADITGDDWDNVGDNSVVYDDYVDKTIDMEFPFKDTVVSPFDFYENERNITKDQMKARLVPLFAICYDTDKENDSNWINSIDSMTSLANWKNKKVVFIGDKFEENF